MMLLVLCIFTQLEINAVVGSEIDSLEAKKYHLFRDIAGFVSAQFIESDDTITVHMKIWRDQTVIDTAVTIDRNVFNTLNSYIQNCRLIIEDDNFRRTFVEEFKVDWPIISHNDIQTAAKSLKGSRFLTTSCCITGGCALGAYAGALITRKTWTEVDTIGIPVGCWAGNGGCTFVPVEITRKYYRINPLVYAGSAAIGSGLGYMWAKHQSESHQVIFDAIGRNIIAFDNAGFPITEQDISYSKRTDNEMLFGSLGLVAGLAGSLATAVGLMAPWADMESEESWHQTAVNAPIIIICSVEFYFITDFFLKKGKKLDRQATIERLKDRRFSQ
jgi:hypothetical protein